MTQQQLVMLWPLANGFDRDQALQAARDDIAKIERDHQLRVVAGKYTLLEPGQMYGTTRWHIAFHGTVQTASQTLPLPVDAHRGTTPAFELACEMSSWAVRDGCSIVITRDGLEVVPAQVADRYFDVAPLADLDDPHVATVHHLPVGGAA